MKIYITEGQLQSIILETSGGRPKLTQDEFIDRSQKINTNPDRTPKYDYSLVDYVDTNTKVKVICPKHKDDMVKEFGVDYFEVYPNTHMQGKGVCPFENKRKERKYSDDEMKLASSKVSNKTEFEYKFPKEYYSARQRNKSLPGFYEEITKHFKLAKESIGEKMVAEILINENLISQECLNSSTCNERQKTFEGCINKREGKHCKRLKFDFFIPTQNTVIEYDGEQHFRPSEKYGGLKFKTTVENDIIKNQFCFKNGIKLIRIPYTLKADEIQKGIMLALDKNTKFQLLGNYPTQGWNSKK